MKNGARRLHFTQHLAQLFGLNKSKLTTGQRYHFITGWL